MKQMKRAISILLALVMLVTGCPVTAFASTVENTVQEAAPEPYEREELQVEVLPEEPQATELPVDLWKKLLKARSLPWLRSPRFRLPNLSGRKQEMQLWQQAQLRIFCTLFSTVHTARSPATPARIQN